MKKTFDIYFNDENNSNNLGFKLSYQKCLDFIRLNIGTNKSYFPDYKGGTVSIVCNETDETEFEVEIL